MSLPVTLARPAPPARMGMASPPAQTAVGTAVKVILLANPRRLRLLVQNTGTTVLYLGLGATPTATAYHVALAAGVAADDGTGGSYLDEGWAGEVRAIGSAGGGTCVVTELM